MTAMLKKIKIIKHPKKEHKKEHSSHVPMPQASLGGVSTTGGMSSGAGMAEGGAVDDKAIMKQAGQATAPAPSNLKVIRKTPFGQPEGQPAQNADKKNYYFGGPVSGSESGAFPGNPRNADEEFDFNKRRGEIMGNPADDFCADENDKEKENPSFAKGGEVKSYAEGGAVVPPEAVAENPNAQAVEPDGAKTAHSDVPMNDAENPEENKTEGGIEEESASPFSQFAKTPGIDVALVEKGNSVYKKIEQALTEGDSAAAEQYIEELRLLVSDIKKMAGEGKKSPEATAAYKSMAADAGDLLSAVENMKKDIGSTESMAAKS